MAKRQKSGEKVPYATLAREGERAFVRLNSPAHGSWLVSPRPGRRTSLSLRPTAGHAPFDLHFPRDWPLEKLIRYLNEQTLFDGYLGRIIASMPGLAEGIVLPTLLLLPTADTPIPILRFQGREEDALLRLRSFGLPVTHRLRTRSGSAFLVASRAMAFLCGPEGHKVEYAYLIRCWLRMVAAEDIPRCVAADPAMAILDAAKKLVPFPRPGDTISISDTCSRWASMGGNPDRGFHMRVNWRAMLLPRPLFRHLLFHELAHTQAMNHQALFYRVLEGYSPGARELERGLDEAWKAMPLWTRGRTPRVR